MRVITDERNLREAEQSRRTQAEMWPIGTVTEAGRTRPVFFAASAASKVPGGPRYAPAGGASAVDSPREGTPETESGPAVVAFVDDAGHAALRNLRGFSTGTPAIVAHVVGGHIGGLGGGEGAGDREAREAAHASVVLESSPAELTSASVSVRHPELGRVDVRVRVSGREVSLRVRASAPAVRAMAAERPQLEESLASQGFRLVGWDLSAGGEPVVPRRSTPQPNHRSHHHLNLEV